MSFRPVPFSHVFGQVAHRYDQSMELESLLLSRDPEVLRVLRLVLEKLNITFEICTSPEAASELLSLKKFDAIVIDCDDLLGGTEVLQQVRKGQSNRSTVTYA